MSRAAVRAYSDKSGQKPSVLATTMQIPDPHIEEIDPGCVILAQWEDILRTEEAEDVVGEIVEELLSHVMETCFRGYIQKQLVPYSISRAKDCLIQILEWQFFLRDEGEGPEVASRTEDTEPLPSTTDSWAQGCVLVVQATPQNPSSPKQESSIQRVAKQTEPRSDQQRHMMAQSSFPDQCKKDKKPSEPPENRTYRVQSPLLLPKCEKKKQRQIHSPINMATDKLLHSPRTSLSSSAKEENEKEKEKAKIEHFISVSRFGSLYQNEDYPSILKLDHACLPQHCVLPQYEILGKNKYHLKHHPKRPSGLPIPEKRPNKQHTILKVHTLKSSTSYLDQPTQFGADFCLSLRKKSSPTGVKRDGTIPFSETLRLDTMNLAQGVSLKDARGTQFSPLKMCPPCQLEPSAELRPMQSNPTLPLYTVEQLTAGLLPQVTPLL
ncbi:uncharacterized protein C2orf81 homolog [Lampris incognitus]|uniref:uncharacterized protein C2orf81 homolog n=1 Tax=Lampris incognitus TaxID=2546036 RepID=UPI0024B546AA|nr:uncharacterized protein C2orf81 homolog [Lampris incognitus]